MISIITAIRDQLPMNQVFYENLVRYTDGPFELIIIDNHSTDGSREYFESQGAKVIVNEANYSYPYCQNQGIRVASGEVLAFFNNDLIVAPQWDLHMRRIMEQEELDIVSFATNDRVESSRATRQLARRWKRIKYPFLAVFGVTRLSLQLTLRLMYGNWEKWCQQRWEVYGERVAEGFSGSCIAISRRGLVKLGPWDEHIQAADFDLYLRSKVRSLKEGDIRPIHLLLGVYFHHYQRLTLKRSYVPFADREAMITINEKWGTERVEELMAGLYQ